MGEGMGEKEEVMERKGEWKGEEGSISDRTNVRNNVWN